MYVPSTYIRMLLLIWDYYIYNNIPETDQQSRENKYA